MDYQQYHKALEFLLDKMTPVQCQDLIRRLALEKKVSERESFLADLKRLSKPGTGEGQIKKGRSLILDISKFSKRAQDGEFTRDDWQDDGLWYGNGLDDDDDTYVSAEWEEELIDLLERSGALARDGEVEAAGKAFAKIFSMLEEEEFPDVFSDALNDAFMDVAPLYVHTVMMNTKATGAAAKAVWNAIQAASSLVPENLLSLDNVMRSSSLGNERWPGFLSLWMQFLKDRQDPLAQRHYRDAVFLVDGLDGLMAHARALGASCPAAWEDALKAMKKTDCTQEAVGAFCMEMLQTIDPSAQESLFAAQELITHAKDRPEWLDAGYQAQVAISPSAAHLVDLLHHDMMQGRNWMEAVLRILQGNPDVRRSSFSGQKHIPGGGSFPHARFFLELLAGDIPALMLCGSLGKEYGWSDGNAASAFFTWSLVFLVLSRKPSQGNGEKASHGKEQDVDAAIKLKIQLPHIHAIWQKYLNQLSDGDIVRNRKADILLESSMRSIAVDDVQLDALESWCRKTLAKRLKYLLDNKFRTAYARGALALCACAGMVASCHGNTAGKQYFEAIRAEYKRFSSFQAELKALLADAQWVRLG